MKNEVLHGLLTARTLFTAARRHCFVRDRHIASAGLTIVQDAFELVVYSCLVEVGVDEVCAIESFSFDQLVGELRKRNLPVLKSGTLRAMNKQRVLIKHHAQLAEPSAVQNYYQTAALAADHLLNHIIGKPLQHIVIADAITNTDVAGHIRDATVAIEERRYLDAMIASRKALFVAVEAEYDIREWTDYDPTTPMPPRLFGRRKAPYYMRNQHWIRDNVRRPTDYLQIDHERIRGEMLEIGIDPEEFFNVWRLTPSVYLHPEHGWAIAREAEHDGAATQDNARYCLDIVVAIVTNQATHNDLARPRPYQCWQARLLRDEPVRTRAAADAQLEGTTLPEGSVHQVQCIVTALDWNGEYVELLELTKNPPGHLHGFIPRDACTIELP